MITFVQVRLVFLRLRRNLSGLAVASLTIAVATLVVMILAAAAHAVEARGQRSTQWDKPAGAAVTAPTGDPLVNVTTSSINGVALTVMEIAAGDTARPAPLGLDQFPAAGTVVVSGALNALVATGEVDGSLLGGVIVGELPSHALIDPGMLAAVRGWDADTLADVPGTVTVPSFPLAPVGQAWWQSKTAVYLGLLLLGLGIVLPCTTLVGATARLTVANQRMFVASLRLIGATRTQTASLIALEAGLAGLCGGAVGATAFVTLRPALATIRVGGAAFLPTDITPGLAQGCTIVLAVVLLCCVSALGASRSALREPLATARGIGVNPIRGRWGLILVLMSVVLLLVAVIAGPGSEIRVGAALGGTVGLVAGVVVIGPAFIGWLGRKTARAANSPAVLLAARAMSADASSAFRPAVGLFLAVFFATLANGYATGNLRDGQLAWANGSASVAVAVPGGNPDRVSNYLDTVENPSPDLRPVALWQTSDERSGLGIVIASCADLAALKITQLPTCFSDQPVLAASYLTDLPQTIKVGDTTIDIPSAPPRFTTASNVTDGLGTDLVVDPALLTQQDIHSTHAYRILAATTTPEHSNLLAAAAVGTLPGSTTRVNAAELSAFNEPVTEARRIVNGLLLVTLFLAAASVITATIGRALNRGPTYSRLRAAGTPLNLFTRALYLETCLVISLAVVGGVVTGSLVAYVLVTTLGGVFSPSVPLTLLIAAAGIVIPIMATLFAVPTMKRASSLKFMTVGPQG